MTDVSSMGMTTFKTINVSSIKAQTDTSKDVNFKRSLTLNSQDDSGETTALFFNLKSVAPAISSSQSQLNFSLPTRIKKVAAAAVGTDLVPKNVIDTIVDTTFTGFPTRLITPMQLGWGEIGGSSNIFRGIIDSGVCYSLEEANVTNNLFICNKYIPIAAGTKVYIELELLYEGDNDNGTKISFDCPLFMGLVNQAGWTNINSQESLWATAGIASTNGCCYIGGKAWEPDSYILGNINGLDTSWNEQKITTGGGYVDTITNSGSYFRSGMKIQMAYDVDNDNMEIVMFDGPHGNGLVNGIRMKNIFTAATAGTFATLAPTYFSITMNVSMWHPNDPIVILPQVIMAKNKIGYYRGTMTDVVELI